MAENSSGNTGNKKAPQDRKPPQKRAASQQAKQSEKGVDREVLSIGLDFRPLPIDLGDGRIWEFNPDPSPEAWSQLQGMLTSFGDYAKTPDTTEGVDVNDLPQLADMLGDLRNALAEMLVDDGDQRQRFHDGGYGLMALQRLAVTVVENLTGFPIK